MNVKPASGKLNGPRLATMLFSIVIIASLAWLVYFSIVTISIPYQLELREGTAMVTTEFLLNGENPYALENQPLGINVYGIGYSLVVLPFASLFGNTLLVHRAVTFTFIVLSATVVFATISSARKNGELILPLLGGTFMATGLIGYAGIGAFPAGMGAFLYLMAILLPFIRSFDRTSLFASVLFSLAAFYTKPYYVLAFLIVLVYLFLSVSKKKALFYGITFSLLFLALFVLVRLILPLYFINIFAANVSLTGRYPYVLKAVLYQVFLFFYPALFLGMVTLAGDLFENGNRVFNLREGISFSSLLDWNQPLIRIPVNYLFFSFAIALTAFLLVLGQHGGGTGLNYMNQLVVPLFFCWLLQSLSFRDKFRYVILVVLFFNLFAWGRGILDPEMLKQKDSRAWAELFEYMSSSSNILNSQVAVSEMIRMGLEPVDSGQTIIFYEIGEYPQNKLFGWSREAILADGVEYTKEIDFSIKKQNYDLILVTDGKAVFFHDKLLPEYYSQIAVINVDMPQTNHIWKIQVWKPKVE